MKVIKALMVFVVIGYLLFLNTAAIPSDQDPKGDETTLQEVVVTATRTTEEISRIPANITVITKRDIEASNARNIPDLLRGQEGVVVRDYLGNGKTVNVDLRGFGETGPSNTLVLVDGRRVNSVDLSGVDWTQIPIDQIERIEIVRGTGSVLYGDNAVGGVINIITKTPEKRPHTDARVTLGSYDWNKGSLSLSGGKGKVLASLFANYDSTDGYRENGALRGKDIGGKFVFDPIDALRLTLNGSYHADRYGLPGGLTKAQLEQDRRGTSSPQDNAHTIDKYAELGIDMDLGALGRVMANVSYRRRDSQTNWISWGWKMATEMKTKGLTPRYILEKELAGHKNRFIAGIDLYWTDMDIRTSSEGIDKDSQGYYFNDEFSIIDNLVLSLGARHERAKYEFGTNSTDAGAIERKAAYSAGLTYLYGNGSSVFVRANKSFRFPLTDEVFSSFSGLNENLRPQSGQHYEIGVRHNLGDKVRTAATLFRAKIDNEIFYNPLTFSNENHPKTLHQGMELSVKARPCKFFTCYGNYTYEKATFEEEPFDGNKIPAVPKHKVSLGFTVHDIISGLRLSAQYNYMGSSYAISDQANEKEKLDSYYTIDSKVSYEWKNIEAFVGVNNLTNKKYSQYAVAGRSGLVYYPSPERNWSGGLKIRF